MCVYAYIIKNTLARKTHIRALGGEQYLLYVSDEIWAVNFASYDSTLHVGLAFQDLNVIGQLVSNKKKRKKEKKNIILNFPQKIGLLSQICKLSSFLCSDVKVKFFFPSPFAPCFKNKFFSFPFSLSLYPNVSKIISNFPRIFYDSRY